jgi:autotransporter-associated beta strand protein
LDGNRPDILILADTNNNYSGRTTIKGSTLKLSRGSNTLNINGNGNVTINNSGIFKLNGNNQEICALSDDDNGNSRITLNCGNITDSSSGGSLVKTGSGELALTGSNTYSGGSLTGNTNSFTRKYRYLC